MGHQHIQLTALTNLSHWIVPKPRCKQLLISQVWSHVPPWGSFHPWGRRSAPPSGWTHSAGSGTVTSHRSGPAPAAWSPPPASSPSTLPHTAGIQSENPSPTTMQCIHPGGTGLHQRNSLLFEVGVCASLGKHEAKNLKGQSIIVATREVPTQSSYSANTFC